MYSKDQLILVTFIVILPYSVSCMNTTKKSFQILAPEKKVFSCKKL